MAGSFKKTYRLLRPEILPRIGILVSVVVLAAISAMGQKAPLLLMRPLWDRVLFPPPIEEALVDPGIEDGAAAEADMPRSGSEPTVLVAIDRWFVGLQDSLGGAIYGDPLEAPALAELTPEERSDYHDERKWSALWAVSAILVVVAIVCAVSQYWFTWLGRWVTLRMVVDLRMRVAHHLMDLSMRYHGDRKLGDVLSRISSDVQSTLNVVQLVLRDVVQQPMLVMSSMAVAYFAAPGPTIGVLLGLPLVALPVAILGKRVRKRSRKSLTTLGASVQVLTQMFLGIRTVKSFRAEQRELQGYRDMNERYLADSMRMVRAVASIQSSTLLITHIGFAALLAFVGYFIIEKGSFSDGSQMMTFFLAISLVYSHVKRMTHAVNRVQEASGAAERLEAVLAENIDVKVRPDARGIDSVGEGIHFEDVTFAYPDAEGNALESVSLSIRAGETLALVGPSGAGKTTLFDVIARFIDPVSGAVRVDGEDLRDLSLDDWTGLYALVGQDPFLFHTSIGENIGYGKPGATEAEIEAAARAANIHEFIVGLPEGYRTLVGEEGSRLSGGQRQRITIARAILKGAPVLLLDEATSALDSESEAAVQEALDRLMKDRTVLVIAHRLSTVRNADRIAVLEKGRLVELGPHDELLRGDGVYRRLYSMQFPEEVESAEVPADATLPLFPMDDEAPGSAALTQD